MGRIGAKWRITVAMLAWTAAAWVTTPARAATPITDDPSCWTMLNELAAAAVFADLSDDKLENVYALLDQLQDHCEGQAFEAAGKTARAIEMLVGK